MKGRPRNTAKRGDRAPPQQVFGHRLFVLLDDQTKQRVALVVPRLDVEAERIQALLELRQICGASRKNSPLPQLVLGDVQALELEQRRVLVLLNLLFYRRKRARTPFQALHDLQGRRVAALALVASSLFT